MRINIPNTLGLPSQTANGLVATSADEVRKAKLKAKQLGLKFVAVGGGSNIIASRDVEQFVCVMALKGIHVVEESDDSIRVSAAAGENWHAFVMHSLQSNWYGLENLALIPGTVGAAPVQNIGAYGVELSTWVQSVEVMDAEGQISRFTTGECEFAYRESVFKRKPELTILSVDLRLRKTPCIEIGYPELRNVLNGLSESDITPLEVAKAVMQVRSAKLPDPSEHPNVGSFFKNPVVTSQRIAELKKQVADLKTFTAPNGIKISAAQLIDNAGWKERPSERVVCWPNQPLVLVNTNAASAEDILEYASNIRKDIFDRYGVQLELEPSLLS